MNEGSPTPAAGARQLRVLLVGHLATGDPGADGQIAKTRFVADELRRALGPQQVRAVDTGGSLSRRVVAHLELIYHLWRTDVLVAVPGTGAVSWLLPQYCAWRRCFRRRVHVVAVGGWLSRFAMEHKQTLRCLNHCDGIYVQSQQMVRDFEALGLHNVHYMPNSRRFDAVREPVLEPTGPVRSVFISRMIPEKGVEVAIQSVLEANAMCPGSCTLDLYGPIHPPHVAWFRSLEPRFTDAICYKGPLSPSDVQSVLNNYQVMLFPTVYAGEGFAGVLLDGMLAGLAVLASDWLSNSEVIRDGENGFVLPARNSSAFAHKILELFADRSLLLRLQRTSAQSALQYHPDSVMPTLLCRL